MKTNYGPKRFFTGRPFLLFLFLALETFIVFYFLTDYRRNESVYRSKIEQALEASYLGATNSYDHTTKMIFYDVVNKPEVLKLIATALEDREKRDACRHELYRLMLPSYDNQTAIGIRQFHFHLKDGTSFLRMHAPEKYGDNLFRRPGVYLVNTGQKPVTGYEVGYFADGYRYIYPLFYHGRHIGSVEFGITSEGIIDHVNQIYPGHYIFMIDRTTVDDMTYEDWKKMNYRTSDLSGDLVIGEKVAEDPVIASINQKLKKRIGGSLAGMERFVEKETLNGKDHLIVSLPIKNVTGKPVAYFMQYITDEYTGHHSRLAIIDILSFTLLLAVIFYAINTIQSRRKIIEQKNIELERSRNDIERNHRMLSSINKIQSAYIETSTSSEVFDMLLKDLITLTDSEYGFIGKVLQKEDGSPYLKTYALTNIAWSKETRDFYDKYAPAGMEFYNLNTLFGACLKTGEPVFANDPKSDPRQGGLPVGHPALKAFLGVPLVWGGSMIGMVGVANRPGGYDRNLLDYLDTYLKTCTSIIRAHRIQEKRKIAENHLQKAEHELRNIYNSIYGYLTIVDRNFRIVGFNSTVEKQFGSDIKGKLCYEVYQGRSHICPDCGVKKTLETGKPAFTFIPGTPESEPVDVYTAPIFDEKREIIAVVEHGILVTEKVKALEALQESEERYRSLVQNVNSGFAFHRIVLNEEGIAVDYIFLEVNSIFEKLTGLKREDIIGRYVTEVLPAIRESSFDWIGVYGKVALTGVGIHFENYSDALDKWYSVYAYCPQRGYFATIFMDITDRRHAEAQIQQLNEHLTAKNRELEQILFATSHDIKTPLVNIHGFTREIEYSLSELFAILQHEQLSGSFNEKITNIIKEDIPESMRFIQASINKMNGLLESLLKLSRVGRSELKLEDLNMNSLIEGVLQSFEFLIKKKQISISVSQLPPCRGDEIQMPQVFSNLIENALKHLDPSRPGVITISGHRENGDIVYCVEDNGIGIAPSHQEKIFEMFYQLRPGEGEGIGIGLNIVQRIIERHHGKMWLESEPGRGSRFYVSLPG